MNRSARICAGGFVGEVSPELWIGSWPPWCVFVGAAKLELGLCGEY